MLASFVHRIAALLHDEGFWSMRQRRVFAQEALPVIEYVALEFRLSRVTFKIGAHNGQDVVHHDPRYLGVARRIEQVYVIAQGAPKGMRAPPGGINCDAKGFVGKQGGIN